MKIIAILSNKYSGSTITDFMLGAHSRVLSLTELVAFVANGRTPFVCKSCHPPESCPVWTPELTRELVQIGARRGVYDAIRAHTGVDVLVDSSKLIGWYRATLHGIDPSDVLCVHVSKSPHAYAASEKNKTHHSSLHAIDDIADRWWRGNGHILDFIAARGYASVYARYHDVVDHPQAVLSAILRGVGLEYEPGIEQFWNFRQHPLWGNKGARSHFDVTDSRPDDWTDESDAQKRLYAESHQTLFRDEKWRDTLTRADVDRLWSHARVRAMGELLGFAPPFSAEGAALDARAESWTARVIAETAAARREARARHADIWNHALVMKVRRRLGRT